MPVSKLKRVFSLCSSAADIISWGVHLPQYTQIPFNALISTENTVIDWSVRSPQMALLGLLCASLLLGSARADDDRDVDHDRARAALQAGEVLPLSTVLERVSRDYPGQVLEVELTRHDSRWIYKFKLLQPGGNLLRLHVDARTGAVMPRRKGAP